MPAPEAILLIGIPAAGKSSFARERLYDSHVRINLDMLRTRPREKRLLDACLQGRISFVVDNTNVTRTARARYIPAAREAGFRVIGYVFEPNVSACIERNACRDRVVPGAVIRNLHRQMELPSMDEGFDEIHSVRLEHGGS